LKPTFVCELYTECMRAAKLVTSPGGLLSGFEWKGPRE